MWIKSGGKVREGAEDEKGQIMEYFFIDLRSLDVNHTNNKEPLKEFK